MPRGRRRSSRRAAYSPPKPPPAITTSYATAAEASATRPPGAARRASLVDGRAHPRGQAPAHPPGRAGEGVVGHGGEALLVHAQREQQVATRSDGRQLGVGGARRRSVHAAPAGVTAARRPRRPARRRARRARERGRSRAAARARSWPSRSASRPWATGSARARCAGPSGAPRWRPRAAYSSGMIQACAAATSATGAVIGSSQSMPAPAADERDRVEQRPGVPDPPPAAQPALVGARAPRHRGQLGQGLAGGHRAASRRRSGGA